MLYQIFSDPSQPWMVILTDAFVSEESSEGQICIESQNYHILPLPNSWREKAKGKIIRHVPITLYADDTSGNVSKQWNKHILFYFTLSGLPPNFTNQEYHCHFLGTSNVAGVLELAEPIINEIK
jgi:hypothetical protein